ncbi:MAG: DUF177 domain-containing protein [Nevskia sp.]|nr:DUF177 domain-containing protein [Nevskia sp.]
MKEGIPLRVKLSAVSRGGRWQGALPVAEMTRLAGCLAAASGAADAWFALRRDAQGAFWLEGEIRGVLPLLCQRCLEIFDWRFALDTALRLVGSEAEERRLLHDCEPYLVTDDELRLRELAEDELLLALPLAPRCPRCAAPG